MKSTAIKQKPLDVNKTIILSIDKAIVRKHFSLIQKMFADKKAYNRRNFKRGGQDE